MKYLRRGNTVFSFLNLLITGPSVDQGKGIFFLNSWQNREYDLVKGHSLPKAFQFHDDTKLTWLTVNNLFPGGSILHYNLNIFYIYLPNVKAIVIVLFPHR